MSENIEEWFNKIYKNKELITTEIKEKITQNAEILMNKNNQLIFLPLRANHMDIFKILYNKIENVPGILKIVDENKNDGTLLAWLCYLNLNDLLNKCFDNIEQETFNIKESNGDTPLIYMIKHARRNLDTNQILLSFLKKYHKKQPLDIELLLCVDKIPPNFELLNKIIDIYKDDEEDLLVYDSILNSEILYKKIYNVSEQKNINLIFEKISKKDEAFKNTNIMINALKFNNVNILDIIIKNPKITNNTITCEIFLLFHSNKYFENLIKQSGISQSEIDCIYNKIITRSSPLNLTTINSSYKIPNYELIYYLWTNSDRNQEKFEYVNSKTHDKYITEFGCLKNNGGSSIMKEFIDLGMCETRPVENTDQVYMSKLAWAKEHIANPDNILAKTGIRFEHLKHSIKICNYIFYCYDYTTCKIICIGTLLNPRDDKSYELDALCVDSKYPGLGTNFMNYIKKITKQLNQYESTKIKLSAIPRYETVRFYKDKAGFDFTGKDKHGKAILESKLFNMDVNYKKYLKYKAKYMNLRKKLLT